MPEVAFPESVRVDQIDKKHPLYESNKKAWHDLTLMYEGGNELRKNISDLLFQRPTEPTDVFRIRQRFLGHPNHLGTALGWYESALFGKNPQINKKIDGVLVDEKPNGEAFSDFEKDCDGAGTKLVDYYRRFDRDLMLYGRAYRLIDNPKEVAEAVTRADQKAALKPRLVRYDPRCVINWDEQDNGVLNWIIISTKSVSHDDAFPPKTVTVEKWWYFNTTQWAEYERRYNDLDEQQEEIARLKGQGLHALAAEQKVPVDRTIVPEGLWLANRAYLPSLAHLNSENWLLWILFLCNLPMLAVFGKLLSDVQVSEHQWTHLDQNAKMAWIEPSGSAIDKLLASLDRLLEEIFRAMYLISQARSLRSGAMAQSGISKQMDMVPSYEVLAAFGDVVREAMERTYADLNSILGTSVEVEVSGFNFKERDAEQIIGMVQDLQVLQIPSTTFRNQMWKEAVMEALGPDPDQDLVEKIFAELAAAPTLEQIADQQKQQQQLQQDKMDQQFNQQLKQTSDLPGGE